MSAKPIHWLLFSVFFLLFVLTATPIQASAAQKGDSNNTCLTCHEGLYLLHDTGKLYCITTHADHCSGCHDGNPATMKKEEAHLGLLPHPQENNGAKCLECHKREEIPTRMTKYKVDGGFEEVIRPEAYIPCANSTQDIADSSKTNPIFSNWKLPIGASILFGLWLALVFFSPLKP